MNRSRAGRQISRSSLFLLGLLAAAGCRHTRLTVTFKVNGPDGRDFDRLLSLNGAPENTVVSTAEKAVIDFKTDPEAATREGLARTLDAIKRVDRPPGGPRFVWRRPGLDPDLLEALGLESSQAARDFPIKLQVRDGSAAIKIRKTALDAVVHQPGDQICVYEVPMDDPLPDSAFKETPDLSKLSGSKLSPQLRRRLQAALDKLKSDETEDQTPIVAVDPDLANLTKDMFLEKNKILNIPFGAAKRLYTENMWNTASGEEFAACHESVLAGGDAFLRNLVFPDLSGRVKDYTLEQVFF